MPRSRSADPRAQTIRQILREQRPCVASDSLAEQNHGEVPSRQRDAERVPDLDRELESLFEGAPGCDEILPPECEPAEVDEKIGDSLAVSELSGESKSFLQQLGADSAVAAPFGRRDADVVQDEHPDVDRLDSWQELEPTCSERSREVGVAGLACGPAAFTEDERQTLRLVERPVEPYRLVVPPRRVCVVALELRAMSDDEQRRGARGRRDVAAELERRIKPSPTLTRQARLPVRPQGRRASQDGLRPTCLEEELERHAEIVELPLDPVQPLVLARSEQRLVCTFRELDRPRRVAATTGFQLAPLREPLVGVLADRLEHRVAGFAGLVGLLDQVLLDESAERVEVGVADLLGGFKGRASREHGEAGEQCLLGLGEQLVGPVDRGAQRLLAGGGVSRSLGEQREPLVEALGEPLRREGPDAGCGELDREREPVEAGTDRLDGISGAVGEVEVRFDGVCAQREQLDGGL